MMSSLKQFNDMVAAGDPLLLPNKRLVVTFLELAFDNQIESAMALLSPDVQWWVLGRSPALKVSGDKNREQVEKLLRSVAKAVPQGMTIALHSLTAEAERVAVEVEAEGLWLNGKPYRNRYHFLMHVRDDRICSVREYMDTLHLYELMQG